MRQASALTAQLTDRLRALPEQADFAILFPGQGSHRVGAGRDLFDAYALTREVFQRADEAFGGPLSKLCFEGPEEQLADTANAQPAILAVSLACLAAALEGGALRRRPSYLAGHSLGEFTALVTAGAIDLEDAVSLVATRGRLMREASRERPGTMAALVGLNGEALEEVCTGSGVEVCNYNSPSQVVVGGPKAAIEDAGRLAKERGGRALPLNVSGAFHTSLMATAEPAFAAAVEACPIRDPLVPVIGNTTAEPLATAGAIAEELRRQITRPVLWHQTVMHMTETGVKTFVEAGPGGVLSGLIKRAGPGLRALTLDGADSLETLRDV
jgi:[acyl-carrier-protein] S-malonyltransferase